MFYLYLGFYNRSLDQALWQYIMKIKLPVSM